MTAPLEMNPEIRARWVAALRSGEHKQGRDGLRTPDGLCCLGVLCEIAIADGVIGEPRQNSFGDWVYGTHCTGSLPLEVREWAGLSSTDPEVGVTCLSDLNDGVPEEDHIGYGAIAPHTFAEIADLIEGKAGDPS